ncbi:VRR-NUC domain-containing protein [Pseudomonadota bacterium]
MTGVVADAEILNRGLPRIEQGSFPVGYYVENFLVLLNQVDTTYSTILSKAEKSFSVQFRRFSTDAQRLFVRLICRKGPQFRNDRLNYSEITSVKLAAKELAAEKFLSIGLALDTMDQDTLDHQIRELLTKLTKPELLQWFSAYLVAVPKIALHKKMDLVETILSRCDIAQIMELVTAKFEIYSPLKSDEVLVYRLLFFGNLRQDLSEFVVADLGHLLYESYSLSENTRLFRGRKALDTLLSSYKLSKCFYAMRSLQNNSVFRRKTQAIVDQLKSIALNNKVDILALRRKDRLINSIAREYERRGHLRLAVKTYNLAHSPPARERKARIYLRLKYYSACLKQCNEIKCNQPSQYEIIFLEQFVPLLQKKMGKPVSAKKRGDIPVDKVTLVNVNNQKIEQLVLNDYTTNGGKGYFVENQFVLGLFGLAFWEVIFMPVEGAFFNAFQRGPVNMFTTEFYQQRKTKIKDQLGYILATSSWSDEMLVLYDRKYGIANYFTNWKVFTREMLENALRLMSRQHLVGIFDTLVRDVHTYRSGFPDLVLFDREANTYQLVEVKGPGDSLQASQRRWFKHFLRMGIPCKITRVDYA